MPNQPPTTDPNIDVIPLLDDLLELLDRPTIGEPLAMRAVDLIWDALRQEAPEWATYLEREREERERENRERLERLWDEQATGARSG